MLIKGADMKTVTVVNQKGGVGKTTTAVNLAAALAQKSYRVLVVDLDAQAGASIWLSGSRATDGNGVYQVLANRADIASHTVQTQFSIDVVPSNAAMAKIDVELSTEVNRDQRLARSLSKLKDRYDFVLIDCPPGLGLAAINAVCAADAIMIPVDCCIESYEAIPRLMATIRHIEEEYDRKIALYALPTFVERTRIANEIIALLEKKFPGKILPGVRKNTAIAEAAVARKPIFSYDPNTTGAIDYSSVAEELCRAS
jgi:chromosome partitioning protein